MILYKIAFVIIWYWLCIPKINYLVNKKPTITWKIKYMITKKQIYKVVNFYKI